MPTSAKKPRMGAKQAKKPEDSIQRLNRSIDAAEVAVKDLRSGAAKGTRDLIRDPERTLPFAALGLMGGGTVPTAHVDVIDRSVESTNVWLKDVAEACGLEDRRAAYRVLRGFLHALRDRITVDEAAQLAAQLPELVRGIFYEGWDPSGTPEKYHDAEPFLRRIADEALLAGTTEASYAAAGAASVLRRHVSPGEIRDVLAVLPSPVREILEPGGTDDA